MTALQIEHLESAILSDVVLRFINLKESTSRHSLLIKFEGSPTAHAIDNLFNRNLIRRNGQGQVVEYLPTAAAFEFSGDSGTRDRAKVALTIVLQGLKNMFKGEPYGTNFILSDLRRHIVELYPGRNIDDVTLNLGLYLAQDFGVLGVQRLNSPANTEIASFQIGEHAIAMEDPEKEWDKVMARYNQLTRTAHPNAGDAKIPSSSAEAQGNWERISPLGGGGQSEVFLVRSPARAAERARCLQTIRTALDQDKRAELADAMWSYARPDSTLELGAMKIFKIRKDGNEQQALDRLKQETQVLKENRPGLPKLLDSNESERWIVTELFPKGTLEDNISLYQGRPALALKAFLSLVNTVTMLHDENIVHRDIKPANVFVRQDDELVLGDFGIVYLPNQPVRFPRTQESVVPHDYMPPWGEAGGRLESVHANFNVYMLGKLLWCMVSGRLLLQREWFRRAQNDISIMFRHDPHAYMINVILDKCVVENPESCVSIHDLRAMVIAFVSTIDQRGQLLRENVPRPCHVCGHGEYQPELFQQKNPAFHMRLWNLSGGANDINLETVRLFVCHSCGHLAFFRASPR